MKIFQLGAMVLPLLALGCAENSSPQPNTQDKEARIRANLEKLEPDDRDLALEQKYCAVETENRLGSMGKPIKVTIKDEPVFLCCKGCEKAANANPDKTVARVEELRIQSALAQLDPEDRKVAEEQKFCAVNEEDRLGSMGKPVKVMVKDQPVFLCCGGCKKAALQNPDKTLATVKKLKAANKPTLSEPAKERP